MRKTDQLSNAPIFESDLILPPNPAIKIDLMLDVIGQKINS